MSGEEYKCRICEADPSLQGGILQEQGKGDFVIVCGLHLNEDGSGVHPKEITGDWGILTIWGYSEAEGLPGDQDPLKYFDKILQRMQQLGQDDWGLKVVVTVGEVTLEGSTFPKGRGINGIPPPRPQPSPLGTPVQLTNETIFNGMEWKTKYEDNTVPARIDSPWAWAFRADRDGNQNPTQIALQAAIEKAGKKGAEIEGYIYTLGGRDGTLINRKVKGGK